MEVMEMTRLAALFALAALVVTVGCQKNPKPVADDTDMAYQPLNQMDTTSATNTSTPRSYESDPYASDPLVSRYDDPSPAAAPPPTPHEDTVVAGGARTHTMQKGDTLYSLARKYYNDQSKWRKIWEANRAQISDPNRIPLGAKLVIP